MTETESMHSLSNSKYLGIFDYIEDTAKIKTIYLRIVYFLKGI